ncbi:efflux RND transporter periplasmic adaptor subunit [Aliarcobacter butzleri]|uniref:Efflux RND transporter periplasmic adaptor subunit n=1 Tax=Aliarcobacter butzleri TaxID=28197 RepID=A0AAW7Q735_9BACT|nr:efflux RND transporter periplasmic adaptor subunit [Aliarcobacter butzleri]MCG3687897.1 efflux RND transporter periplasmic adaptor subunit [Aliarcobacter butzleri]MCG3703456.1 efflux RND transporter periplasmic adaptor subunit [Aliarcobacter butzleri]MCT7645498.1 efflux RND transporter periplasmic adaptor subunit [Aliarcobacter butzleri]MDN5061031.1 efflux RND transporter periplasmic adaptor subunit [Aliarcobacter butzleri]MDN5114741.1 efflux RND transporter periplasmic adaptor subunit [Ali
MIKNVLILILLLGSFVNAEILDAKQLFNKKITKVKKEEILLSKSFYGITKIDESSTFDIVSRFDGYITNLNANKSYMTIKKGEPLYSIYSSDILSIQNELQISKELNQNIYQSTLLKLDNLDIPKESQEKIKSGKLNNNGLVVTSPTNGILLQKNINNKSSVSKGTTLLQIASLDKIWFIASVYQEDLAFIKKDKQATIYIDGLNTSFNTKVDFIYPIFDDKSKTVDVRFILDNKELNLLPSMFGKVDIIDKQKQLLTLPKTAVLKKSDSFYVFKYVSNDEFKPVKIEAKRINSNKYEIISGLNENDEVIDNALFLLDSDALTNSLYESDNEDW